MKPKGRPGGFNMGQEETKRKRVSFTLRRFRMADFKYEIVKKIGVLKTRSGEPDLDYLHKWANELKVSDLLERALKQAGP